MEIKRLLILLPCHGLEDFPTHYASDAAEGILAAWTALWHPALIAAAGVAPQWQRIDDPVSPLEGALVVVPWSAADSAPPGLHQNLADHHGRLVEPAQGRSDLVARLLQSLPAGQASGDQPGGDRGALDADLVADFHALGYAYLQVQLLTRQMRYSSNLDQARFEALVVQAAGHAGTSIDDARRILGDAFDLLAQERDLYYSVDAYVLDFTAVAATTLDRKLLEQLRSPAPTSLLVLPEVWQGWDKLPGDLLEAWREAVSQQRACVLLGGLPEGHALLAPVEALRGWLLQGRRTVAAHFPESGKVFAQRRYALTPFWPTLLKSYGVCGALHWALDDGRFPQGSQGKTRWRAADGSEVETVSRIPCDAADSANFLTWSRKLGESMDMDHVAVLSIVHWPGGGCDAYHDLIRAANYGAALGRLVTAEHFFRDSISSPHSERLSADRYRSPYLAQDVAAGKQDPLSSTIRYWRAYIAWKSSQGLELMRQALGESHPAAGDDANPNDALQTWPQSATCWDRQRLEHAQTSVRRSAEALAQRLVGVAGGVASAGSAAGSAGYLFVNPMSYPTRVGQWLETPHAELGDAASIYASAAIDAGAEVVVDAPSAGYVWVGPRSGGRGPSSPRGPSLVQDNLLRNEFLQASIHPQTGGLQALHDYRARGNRLSQRLGIRWPDVGHGQHFYADMIADSVDVLASTHLQGAIETQGRLVDGRGARLGAFRQRFSLWRGSRVLVIDIELDLLEEQMQKGEDPWNCYAASRFAWPDAGASITRGINGCRMAGDASRLEAPQYLEIESGEQRTAILTGGLPFHRKPSPTEMDCLLVVRGESERSFRLGIAVDPPRTAALAEQLLAPPLVLPSPSPKATEGWMIHSDARNTVVTSWAPITDAQGACGLEMRIQETEGRPARLKLQAWRPFREARRTDLNGQSLGLCGMEDGAALIELAANEWCQFQALWRTAETTS